MGLGDKITNKANETVGKVKEAVGDALDSPRLQQEGEDQKKKAQADQVAHDVHAKADEVKDRVENKADEVRHTIDEKLDQAKDKIDRTF